jgi:hypothetical protein
MQVQIEGVVTNVTQKTDDNGKVKNYVSIADFDDGKAYTFSCPESSYPELLKYARQAGKLRGSLQPGSFMDKLFLVLRDVQFVPTNGSAPK